MNTNRRNLIFITTAAAGSLLFGPVANSAELIAQAQTSAPPQAPSFLRQAGQVLFDNAQKRMLNNMNQNLQNKSQPQSYPTQPQTQFQTNPTMPYGSTVVPSSGIGAVTSTRKQAAPVRSWVLPNEKPIACMLCIHGLGLQSNSYEFFGKEASNRGIAVYAIDVRGFGSWMNAQGKTKVNFDECLEDIKNTLESIRAANPGLPVYVLGESMGGAIALRAASMYPTLVDGLISSVPAGERFNQGKTSAKVFLNLLTGFNLANVGGDLVNQATKNQKLKSQWQDDPLARLNVSPQELIQFQDFMNFNHEAAKKVADMPVLFVQGIGDTLVKPEGTWELFNDVAAKDKSFFAVPGEHLIFEEAQTQDAGPRDQNFRVIASWLQTKVGRRHGRRGPIANAMGGNGMGGNGMGGNGMGGGMPRMGGGMGGGFPRQGGGLSGGNFWNTQGLEGPAQLIESGQYSNAITELENIRAQRPNDPNVAGLLAKAYYQSGATDKAGPLFRTAMRLRRGGGDQAQALNSYLLSVSQGAQSMPNTGGFGQPVVSQAPVATAQSGGHPFDRLNSFFSAIGTATGATNSGATNFGAPGKAKVYAFYASWADQCKGMDNSLAQLASQYGDRVEINRLNIEDAANDSIADQFKVGPIPTVVFVTPSGQVGSTIIGESTYNNYANALQSVTQMR